MTGKIKAAIIGPGNIGTDLLMKALRSELIEPVWMVGVDPDSPGLSRAAEMGLKVTSEGVDGMLATMKADGVQICFDATSAYVHAENSRKVNEQGALMIDLMEWSAPLQIRLRMSHDVRANIHQIERSRP
jgi:acetaldehyde/propanal dehydrogenase